MVSCRSLLFTRATKRTNPHFTDFDATGHEEECSKQPPRRSLKLLKHQSSDNSTMSGASGTMCSACGLECRVCDTRTQCLKCSEPYCSIECRQWAWESGGHATECNGKKGETKEATKPTLPFHELQKRIYDQFKGRPPVPVPPPQPQDVENIQDSGTRSGSESNASQYTEVSASVSGGSVQTSEYTEETVEDSKESRRSRDEEEDDFGFAGGAERFLDDIPEVDTEGSSSEPTFSEAEADLEINRYGTYVATQSAIPYVRNDTPDTLVTSNTIERKRSDDNYNDHNWVEQGRRPVKTKPSFSSTNYAKQNPPKRAPHQGSPQRKPQSPPHRRQRPPSQRRYQDAMGSPAAAASSSKVNPFHRKWEQEDSPETHTRIPKSQQKKKRTPKAKRERVYYSHQLAEDTSLLQPPSPVKYPLHDVEAPSSGQPYARADENYEVPRSYKNRKRLTVFFAICISFFIGVLVVVATASGLVWFDGIPDFFFSSNRDSNSDSADEPGSSTPNDGPTNLAVARTFLGDADGFGTSVALAGDLMAIGSLDNLVECYTRKDGRWILDDVLAGPDGFGKSVHIQVGEQNKAYLIVGAPESTEAFVYEYDSFSQVWDQVGPPLSSLDNGNARSLSDEPPAEGFGSSVAISQDGYIVVIGTESAQVFVYHYSNDGESLSSSPDLTFVIEGEPTTTFGSAVDVSDDGQTLAIGEPGTQSLHLYAWQNGEWNKSYELQKSMDIDLGTSVSFLSDDFVAVGGPSSGGSKGIVRICQRTNNGWSELPPIIGKDGEELGAIGTISGLVRDGPELFVGSSTGILRRLHLDGEEWNEVAETKSSVAVTSVSASEDTETAIVHVLAGFQASSTAILFSPDSEVTTLEPSQNPVGESASPSPPLPSPTSPGQPSAPTSQPSTSPTKSTQQGLPTSNPTMLPTVTGTIPAEAPTQSPTSQTLNPTQSSPTPSLSWVETAGPLLINESSGFGTAVAIAGTFMASSEPGSSNGAGRMHLYSKNGDSWQEATVLSDSNSEAFGSALDMKIIDGKAHLLVGAENTEDDGGYASFGSFSYYRLDDSGWSQVGNTIKPAFNLVESGGKFGGAVAMAQDIQRIVVGAPDSSLDGNNLDTGRVYTYEYNGSDWVSIAGPVVGNAESMLGTSLDISKDGNKMLVGAPQNGNGNGAVYFYEWDQDNGSWGSILPVPGGDGELLGTSVAILNDDATLIALGGPGYGNNQGVIKVYKDFDLAFFRYGIDIVGQDGEGIGKTLAGSNNRIAYGTDLGSFQVLEWEVDQWVPIASGPNLGSPVVSIALSEAADTVVVGLENETTYIYRLQ